MHKGKPAGKVFLSFLRTTITTAGVLQGHSKVRKALFWDAANAKTLAQYNLASLLMLSGGGPQGADEQLAAQQADGLFREVLGALRERKRLLLEASVQQAALRQRCVGMTAQQRRIVADTCGDRSFTSALK